jgi:hypothetical protein
MKNTFKTLMTTLSIVFIYVMLASTGYAQETPYVNDQIGWKGNMV